jgi:ribosomal protein S18 acetylase RimI-like enzyme
VTWSSRPYETPADLRLMQAFTSECWRSDWPAPAFHPGDLDWWSRDSVSGAVPLSERVRLWFAGEADASDLVAWGWFGLPHDLDLLVRPDARGSDVPGAIVDWAAERARALAGPAADPDPVQAFVADSQPLLIDSLKQLGFAAAAGGWMVGFTRRFEGRSVPGPALPPGFIARTLATGDIAERVALGKLAFPNSHQTPERYEVARRSTLYRPALDQLIIGPDGRLVALALGWLDPVTLSLELEPVAVDPAWQRHGLGRAVCLAAIRAGIALGATTGVIYAETHNDAALGLYASLGYEITTRMRPYRRPPPD